MPVSADSRPGTLPLDRVKVRRTFEVIVDLIKDRIFSGEYRPGDRLPAEREAAERLGVGRPAVREAYRALEMVGIVQIRKGKQGGAFIVERDRRTVTETLSDLIRLREVRISELTEARMVLETRVAELAMHRVGAEEIARLRACIDAAVERSKLGITATAENVRFHVLLGEMSGNRVLSLMLASTLDLLQIVIGAISAGPEVSLANAQEHYDIVEALRTGSAERLRPILEDHIRKSNDELVKLAERSPLFATRPAPGITRSAHGRVATRAADAGSRFIRGAHGKK